MKKFFIAVSLLCFAVTLTGCSITNKLPMCVPYYKDASLAVSNVAVYKVMAQEGEDPGYAPFVFVTVDGSGLKALTEEQSREAENQISVEITVSIKSVSAKIPEQNLALAAGTPKVNPGETSVVAYTYAGSRYTYFGDDIMIDFSDLDVTVTATVTNKSTGAKKRYEYKTKADTKEAITAAEISQIAGSLGNKTSAQAD